MAETKSIGGVFTATVRKEGKLESKKFKFRASHPPHIHGSLARSLHVETLIAIANGEKVSADEVKKHQLEAFDKEAAQAELQHLVDVGYLYLEQVKPSATPPQ